MAHPVEALNMVSGKIETPLITAIKLGDIDMVKMLLDNGADVGAKDCEGKDAMEWAREKGLKSILNLWSSSQNIFNISSSFARKALPFQFFSISPLIYFVMV